MRRRALTALLYLVQPIARLRGRMDHGLTPWRRRGSGALALPRPRSTSIWSEQWAPAEERLAIVEEGLRGDGIGVECGGDFDRWDLQVRGGILGAARMRMAIEEHGAGRQLVRFRVWPRPALGAVVLCALLAPAAVLAVAEGPVAAALSFGGLAALLAARSVYETALATGALLRGLHRQERLAAYDLAAHQRRRLRPSPLEPVDTGEVG
jgi:hypothetical protein